VTQIAERAGLTQRTSFRYFADKREVLFAGSDQLPGVLTEAVRATGQELAPLDAVLMALAGVGALMAEHAPARRRVIDSGPDGPTGTGAHQGRRDHRGALRERSLTGTGASLLARVGAATL